MDILVFTMVGEWRCKEQELKFEPDECMFGRYVRVKENMTYTEFVHILCEVFSLKYTECNPIISYWMSEKMSMMIESKRSHVGPNKGGVKIVKNKKDELIPTRTITGH